MPAVNPVGDSTVRALYARVKQRLPDDAPVVVLRLGSDAAWMAFGTQWQPEQVVSLHLGLATLADRYFPEGLLNPLGAEQAIADVEDVVMPWHRRLPPSARFFTDAAPLLEVAVCAGAANEVEQCPLAITEVEHLFNRWVARVQGRPASQDPLPATVSFAVALLVLRECLHHWSLDGITVLGETSPSADGTHTTSHAVRK